MPLIWFNAHNLSHVMTTSSAVFVLLVALMISVYALLAYCIFRLALSIRRLKRCKGI